MVKKYSRTKNSIFNIITGFGGQIIYAALNFVCRTVFIKTLGAEYLGINGLFSDILSLFSLAELGFDTAISFRLYKPIAENDEVKIRQYVKMFRNVYKVVGLVIVCCGLTMVPFLRIFIKDYDKLSGLGINATFIFILFLTQNASSYLFLAYRSIVITAHQKQYLLSVAGYVINLVNSIVKVLVLIFTHSFIAYIITITAQIILQSLINAAIATKAYPQYFIKEKTKLSKEEKVELYKDCGALLVYKINNVVIKATDNLVLSSFVGLTIVGLYSNYLMLFNAIHGVLHIMFRSVKASMGDLFASDEIEKKHSFFEIMNFITILLYGTAAVGIAITSNELIDCWIGDKYVVPQPLPMLIGLELLFTGLKLNLAQIRNVSGVFKQMWYRPVIGSIINVVSSIILVQYWGISGVITGTVLAAIFANFMVDPRVIYKYSFQGVKPVKRYYSKNILFIIILMLICAVDFVICENLVTGYGIISLAIHMLICAVSVPATFVLIFWKTHECVYIRQKVRSIIRI
ncbi:MAG: oligosaccharide flippase family protein [Clostridia bacterium]|nr:oligosaccharide flippase family protein [Clostridia bacterium]